MLACLIIFGNVDQSLFPRKDIAPIPFVGVCVHAQFHIASKAIVYYKVKDSITRQGAAAGRE